MSDVIKIHCSVAKEAHDIAYMQYKKLVSDNFGLSCDEIEEMNNFFERSNLVVEQELLAHYRDSVTGKRKGNNIDFKVNAPVLASMRCLKEREIYYLKHLYTEKLIDDGFGELGLAFINIQKKYWPYRRVTEDIYFEDDFRNTYVIQLGFSLCRQLCEEKKQKVFVNKNL